MLPARVGEVPVTSERKLGTRSGVWSEGSLGGDTHVLSGELAEVTAAGGRNIVRNMEHP